MEFNGVPSFALPEADVCVLAGDWCVADRLKKQQHLSIVGTFLDMLSKKYEHVLTIAGNHEHYHGAYYETKNIISHICSNFPNIKFLEQDSVEIGDVVFHGTTLWTDFRNGNFLDMYDARTFMNDYRLIRLYKESEQRITPEFILNEHKSSLEWLQKAIDPNKTNVVITHHSPTWETCRIGYKDDSLTPAYCSELSPDLFSKVKLWLHGHVHNQFDIEHCGCRIVVNPLGYPNEVTGFNPNLVLEI